MKKNKSSKLNLFALIGIGLGIVTIIMFFLAFINRNAIIDASYTGFQVAFGTDIIKATALTLIGFILVVIGLIFAIISLLTKSKIAKLLTFISIVAMIVGGVFIFLTKGSFINTNNLNLVADTYSLGIGGIIGGITAILAGISQVIPFFKK